MTITNEEYKNRRRKLSEIVGKDSIVIVPSAKEVFRNGDSDYLFRQNSNFYYLTGFNEPDAVAVLASERPEGEYVLFNRVRDIKAEIWNGKRAGQAGAVSDYGADQAFPYEDLDAKMPELLKNYRKVYFPIGMNPEFDQRILSWIKELRHRIPSRRAVPTEFIDIRPSLYAMRLIKSPAEINLMRYVAKASAGAHRKAMQACRPGLWEYQIQAVLLKEFSWHHCFPPAYNCIVAGGENACVLHYNENNAELKNGDMLLIDAAGEYQNYAADITRTFPVNGRFTHEQRAIYELVLLAQKNTIAMVKPGVSAPALQANAIRILSEGLLSLGLLKGTLEEVIKNRTYTQFYMHNVGHWLGLDTHDAGSYRLGQEENCLLEPGMVFTIEPGIYIQPHENIEKKWWNIGVRIEDNILVTETGNEILSIDAPKEITEIEALMAESFKEKTNANL